MSRRDLRLSGVAEASQDALGKFAQSTFDLPDLDLEHGQLSRDGRRGADAASSAGWAADLGSRLNSDASDPASTRTTTATIATFPGRAAKRRNPEVASSNLPKRASRATRRILRAAGDPRDQVVGEPEHDDPKVDLAVTPAQIGPVDAYLHDKVNREYQPRTEADRELDPLGLRRGDEQRHHSRDEDRQVPD